MKMDRKLLSSQKHEIAYMARKLKVSQRLIRLARAKAGTSRMRVKVFVLGFKAAAKLAEEETASPRLMTPGVSNDRDF